MKKLAPQSTEAAAQIGEAMQKLPNDRWRLFVYYFLTGKPGYGAASAAVRKAGLGENAKPGNIRRIAYQMCHDRASLQRLARKAGNSCVAAPLPLFMQSTKWFSIRRTGITRELAQ